MLQRYVCAYIYLSTYLYIYTHACTAPPARAFLHAVRSPRRRPQPLNAALCRAAGSPPRPSPEPGQTYIDLRSEVAAHFPDSDQTSFPSAAAASLNLAHLKSGGACKRRAGGGGGGGETGGERRPAGPAPGPAPDPAPEPTPEPQGSRQPGSGGWRGWACPLPAGLASLRTPGCVRCSAWQAPGGKSLGKEGSILLFPPPQGWRKKQGVCCNLVLR